MVKPLSLDDFRAVRHVYEPDDFALSGGPDPEPTDLISPETWSSIMGLPDDVSIRTTNHHGTEARILHSLWGAWLEAMGDDPEHFDLVGTSMLDATDEFQAATFNLLCGFYRQAIGCLRNVLDVVSIGAYCQAFGKALEFTQWREGTLKHEYRFGEICESFLASSQYAPLAAYLRTAHTNGVFDRRRGQYPGGWARQIYGKLSKYAHSRPNHTNADLWASNGPIYDDRAVLLTTGMFIEVAVLSYVFVKLCRPDFELPDDARSLFESGQLLLPRWAKVPKAGRLTYHHLFHASLLLT